MIKVNFLEGSDLAQANGLWQWDYGQKLEIHGLKLPTAAEIHFSLSESGGESITRIGNTKDEVTVVPIPDTMLENESEISGYRIYGYIYITDPDNNSGKTVKKICINVQSRPKPQEFDLPDEKELFAEVIKTVNDSANAAKAASESAAESLNGAQEAEQSAKQYAENAKLSEGKSAENASTAAENASKSLESAVASEASAKRAENSENSAQISKESASASASDAQNSSESARTYSVSAKASADAAKASKENAAESESSAKTHEETIKKEVSNFEIFAKTAKAEITSEKNAAIEEINQQNNTKDIAALKEEKANGKGITLKVENAQLIIEYDDGM